MASIRGEIERCFMIQYYSSLSSLFCLVLENISFSSSFVQKGKEELRISVRSDSCSLIYGLGFLCEKIIRFIIKCYLDDSVDLIKYVKAQILSVDIKDGSS